MFANNLPLQQVRALSRPSFSAGILVAAALLTAGCSDLTAPSSAVPLRSPLSIGSSAASNFPVLANAAVTCTGGNIAGNVGTFLGTPTGTVTQTSCPITGTVYVGGGIAEQAFNDFLNAYAALAPKAGDVCTTLTGTLGGVILSPGAYCFDAAATLTSVLTLDGPPDAVWIFRIGTSGTGALTGTNFSVALAGGAQACNVTWWVADAATMTTSGFQGNILAGAGITLTGGTFAGNAWSKADATITGTVVTPCGHSHS